MFFMLYCLRPVAHEMPPPERLKLMSQVMKRFFNYVAFALALTWISGLYSMLTVGFKSAPLNWHLMLSIGLVMTLVFTYIWLFRFPQMIKALEPSDCQAPRLPEAGRHMNAIRALVMLNLALGLLTIAIATIGRVL